MGEARSTLVQAVFDFPRESKRGAVKHGERKREREGGGGEQRLAQRSQQPPRHLPVYLARDAARIKIANAIFLIRHPSLSRIPSPLGKHPVVESLTANFPVTHFHGVFLARASVFSSRAFFSPTACKLSRVSRNSRRANSPSPFRHFRRKCFLCRAFSRRGFSLVMHFSVLLISRHIFPRTPFPFFYRGLSLVTRPFIFHVFSPARSSLRFFPSSAPPSRLFSPSVFQSLISLILSPHIFSPEAISVANLPVNPSAVDFSTCSFLLRGFSLSLFFSRIFH